MSIRRLKLTVAYDGTAYAGWQIQPTEPTVQAAVEAAWREITREDVRLMAAGRTDAGVHAFGQVVSLATESTLSSAELQRGLNAVLPEDVAVVAIDEAPANFHATHDAQRKTYRYHIHNGRTPDVFNRRYVWHYPQPLDAEKMHAAAQALLGKHDFSSFESAGSERPDTVRTIMNISVDREGEASAEPSPPRLGRSLARRAPIVSRSKSPATASSTIWSGRSSARSWTWGRGPATSRGPPRSSPSATAAPPARLHQPTACFLSAWNIESSRVASDAAKSCASPTSSPG